MQWFHFVVRRVFLFSIIQRPVFLARHSFDSQALSLAFYSRFIIATIALAIVTSERRFVPGDECVHRFADLKATDLLSSALTRALEPVPLDESRLFAPAWRQSHSQLCSAALLTNDVRFMRAGNNVNTLYHSSERTNGCVPLSVQRSVPSSSVRSRKTHHVRLQSRFYVSHLHGLRSINIISDTDNLYSDRLIHHISDTYFI